MSERPHAEEHIWRPLAEHPELIGYAGALALNHVQLGNQSGYADLVLLPAAGNVHVVVVEAKHANDRRSSADVIGQILKYYAHALDLGTVGLEALRAAARSPRPSRQISFKALLKAASLSEAEQRCAAGPPLPLGAVRILVAVDDRARRFERRLYKTASVICERHKIPIGIVIVSPSGIEWMYPANGA